MMRKKIVKLLLSILLIAVVFFVSYGLSLKSERVRIAQLRLSEKNTEITVYSADETTSAEASERVTEPLPVVGTPDKLPTPIIVNMPSDDTWSLVLLNEYYKMNDTYEPHLDECLEGTDIYLDKRVAKAFAEMYDAAIKDGVTLTPVSGYVSPDRQKRSFEKQVDSFMSDGYIKEKAEALAANSVLPVGCSEHNYGLAVDIGNRTEDFVETPAYSWLKQHGAEYGFIERYTAVKEEKTHFNASPWHWRFVGEKYAKEIVSKGMCLEEYVQKVNQ